MPQGPPTKDRIIDAANRLFYAEGIRAVSVDAIAEKAGFTKKTLYYHFKSKDDIYARIAFLATQHLNTFVEERIPASGTAAEKVRAYMRASATFFAEHRTAWMAASTAFWSDPDRHRMEIRIARRRQFETRLRDLIREGVENGEFEPVDPAITGRLILSGINWMHRWWSPDGERSAQQIADDYADIILKGMIRRTS